MRVRQDPKKALEVLLYIAQQTSNIYNVLRVIYLADRLHLAKYGRLIYPEQFTAMDYGPVASLAYDILKGVQDGRLGLVAEGTVNTFRIDGDHIRPEREPDLSRLSESDIECIDEALQECGNMSFDELVRLAYTDLAYQRTSLNERISLIDIAEDLGIPELVSYLQQQGCM